MIQRTPLPPRRAPLRRVSRSSSAVARRAKDAAWRDAVLARAGGKCERCGSGRTVDAHHVRGKQAHPLLRHVVSNGVALCRMEHIRAHNEPGEFAAWWAEYVKRREG